jgi:membrane protease YdiL (CAAX protease family)
MLSAMKTFLRIISILPTAIAALLVYAVIHAANSDGGARVGVAILYIVVAIALGVLVTWMWRFNNKRNEAPAAPPAA